MAPRGTAFHAPKSATQWVCIPNLIHLSVITLLLLLLGTPVQLVHSQLLSVASYTTTGVAQLVLGSNCTNLVVSGSSFGAPLFIDASAMLLRAAAMSQATVTIDVRDTEFPQQGGLWISADSTNAKYMSAGVNKTVEIILSINNCTFRNAPLGILRFWAPGALGSRFSLKNSRFSIFQYQFVKSVWPSSNKFVAYYPDIDNSVDSNGAILLSNVSLGVDSSFTLADNTISIYSPILASQLVVGVWSVGHLIQAPRSLFNLSGNTIVTNSTYQAYGVRLDSYRNLTVNNATYLVQGNTFTCVASDSYCQGMHFGQANTLVYNFSVMRFSGNTFNLTASYGTGVSLFGDSSIGFQFTIQNSSEVSFSGNTFYASVWDSGSAYGIYFGGNPLVMQDKSLLILDRNNFQLAPISSTAHYYFYSIYWGGSTVTLDEASSFIVQNLRVTASNASTGYPVEFGGSPINIYNSASLVIQSIWMDFYDCAGGSIVYFGGSQVTASNRASVLLKNLTTVGRQGTFSGGTYYGLYLGGSGVNLDNATWTAQDIGFNYSMLQSNDAYAYLISGSPLNLRNGAQFIMKNTSMVITNVVSYNFYGCYFSGSSIVLGTQSQLVMTDFSLKSTTGYPASTVNVLYFGGSSASLSGGSSMSFSRVTANLDARYPTLAWYGGSGVTMTGGSSYTFDSISGVYNSTLGGGLYGLQWLGSGITGAGRSSFLMKNLSLTITSRYGTVYGEYWSGSPINLDGSSIYSMQDTTINVAIGDSFYAHSQQGSSISLTSGSSYNVTRFTARSLQHDAASYGYAMGWQLSGAPTTLDQYSVYLLQDVLIEINGKSLSQGCLSGAQGWANGGSSISGSRNSQYSLSNVSFRILNAASVYGFYGSGVSFTFTDNSTFLFDRVSVYVNNQSDWMGSTMMQLWGTMVAQRFSSYQFLNTSWIDDSPMSTMRWGPSIYGFQLQDYSTATIDTMTTRCVNCYHGLQIGNGITLSANSAFTLVNLQTNNTARQAYWGFYGVFLGALVATQSHLTASNWRINLNTQDAVNYTSHIGIYTYPLRAMQGSRIAFQNMSIVLNTNGHASGWTRDSNLMANTLSEISLENMSFAISGVQSLYALDGKYGIDIRQRSRYRIRNVSIWINGSSPGVNQPVRGISERWGSTYLEADCEYTIDRCNITIQQGGLTSKSPTYNAQVGIALTQVLLMDSSTGMDSVLQLRDNNITMTTLNYARGIIAWQGYTTLNNYTLVLIIGNRIDIRTQSEAYGLLFDGSYSPCTMNTYSRLLLTQNEITIQPLFPNPLVGAAMEFHGLALMNMDVRLRGRSLFKVFNNKIKVIYEIYAASGIRVQSASGNGGNQITEHSEWRIEKNDIYVSSMDPVDTALGFAVYMTYFPLDISNFGVFLFGFNKMTVLGNAPYSTGFYAENYIRLSDNGVWAFDGNDGYIYSNQSDAGFAFFGSNSYLAGSTGSLFSIDRNAMHVLCPTTGTTRGGAFTFTSSYGYTGFPSGGNGYQASLSLDNAAWSFSHNYINISAPNFLPSGVPVDSTNAINQSAIVLFGGFSFLNGAQSSVLNNHLTLNRGSLISLVADYDPYYTQNDGINPIGDYRFVVKNSTIVMGNNEMTALGPFVYCNTSLGLSDGAGGVAGSTAECSLVGNTSSTGKQQATTRPTVLRQNSTSLQRCNRYRRPPTGTGSLSPIIQLQQSDYRGILTPANNITVNTQCNVCSTRFDCGVMSNAVSVRGAAPTACVCQCAAGAADRQICGWVPHSWSATITKSASQSLSESGSSSSTTTATLSTSGSLSVSSSLTVTASNSKFTGSPSWSATGTLTGTGSRTLLISETWTWVATPTLTGSLTKTALVTESKTGSFRRSPSRTLTLLQTETVTLKQTDSFTASFSVSRSLGVTVSHLTVTPSAIVFFPPVLPTTLPLAPGVPTAAPCRPTLATFPSDLAQYHSVPETLFRKPTPFNVTFTDSVFAEWGLKVLSLGAPIPYSWLSVSVTSAATAMSGIPSDGRLSVSGFSSLSVESNFTVERLTATSFQLSILTPLPQLHLEEDELIRVALNPVAFQFCAPEQDVVLGYLVVQAVANPQAAATQTAVTVATTTAVATSALGAAAALDAQALAVLALMSCSRPADRQLLRNTRLLSPLATSDTLEGMIAGNIILISGVGLLQLLVVLIRHFKMKESWQNARMFARCPGFSFTICCITFQGLGICSLKLLASRNEAPPLFFASLAILVAILIPVLVAVVVWRYVTAEFHRYDYDSPAFRGGKLKYIGLIFFPYGHWLPKKVSTAYGSMFTGLRYSRAAWSTLPLWTPSLMVIGASFHPTTLDGCEIQYGCLSAGQLLIAVILVIARPFRSTLANVLAICSAFCVGTVLITNTVLVKHNSPDAQQALMTAVQLQTAFTLCRVAVSVFHMAIEGSLLTNAPKTMILSRVAAKKAASEANKKEAEAKVLEQNDFFFGSPSPQAAAYRGRFGAGGDLMDPFESGALLEMPLLKPPSSRGSNGSDDGGELHAAAGSNIFFFSEDGANAQGHSLLTATSSYRKPLTSGGSGSTTTSSEPFGGYLAPQVPPVEDWTLGISSQPRPYQTYRPNVFVEANTRNPFEDVDPDPWDIVPAASGTQTPPHSNPFNDNQNARRNSDLSALRPDTLLVDLL